MPRIAQPFSGDPLIVQRREPPFSFWPTKHSGGRPGIQAQVFTNDPWNIIESSITRRCPATRKNSAEGFYEQAKDFYGAAKLASLAAAKPVLIYYSILNLCKAYILTFGSRESLEVAKHGISETNAGLPITQHRLTCYPSTNNTINIFAELYEQIEGVQLRRNLIVPVQDILAQIILGHRMWCLEHNKKERFVRLARVQYMVNRTDKNIWLRFFVFVDDLARMGINHRELLELSELSSFIHEVDARDIIDGRDVVCFEEIDQTPYRGWPSDELGNLSRNHQNLMWSILANSEPYRKYYLYLAPPTEIRLPQLLSIYLFAYYLSSVTRYRPDQFKDILFSKIGSQIREFIDHQIIQFLFMMASFFEKRDVVKPAVI